MIFAKLKSAQQNFRILASSPENVRQFDFYTMPTIVRKIRFDPEVKLENDEWYWVQLNNDQLNNMVRPYLNSASSSGDLDNAAASEYHEIGCIYRIYNDYKAIFTRITESKKVRSQKLIIFKDTEQAEVFTERDAIEFDGRVDAYFDGANKIYFKDYKKLTNVFSGFSEFYRVATEIELQNFLDIELFEIGELEPYMISQTDSRKIAKILSNDTIALASGASDQRILASVRSHPELNITITSNNKILLQNQFILKLVLKLIMGRYFNNEVTGEEMEATGALPISERIEH